jgi:hypothetical protein
MASMGEYVGYHYGSLNASMDFVESALTHLDKFDEGNYDELDHGARGMFINMWFNIAIVHMETADTNIDSLEKMESAMAGQSVGSYFNNKQEGRFSVAFPEKYFTQLWPFVSQKSVIMDRKSEAKNAKYFVFPVWEDQSSTSAFKLNYVGTIDFRGVALYKVYEQVF